MKDLKYKNVSISFWRGQAYLHKEWKAGKLKFGRDVPLGSNDDYILSIKKMYKCPVKFLNDDLTIDTIIK